MSDTMETTENAPVLGAGPSRRGSLADILLYIAAALGFYGIEALLRAVDMFPFPGLFDGGMSQIASFFVVIAIMKRRGQTWSDFGLRRPRRWWFIPVWGLIVLVVVIFCHLTVVPLLGFLLRLDPPDLTRYDILKGNLPMLMVAMPGAMLTGGFIEEFIYRGMMIDRLCRIFGGTKQALIFAALLNGVPFGIIHFEWGVGGMVSTMVMGSVLGVMYLATKRNLWPMIAAHATLDAVLMLQVYYGVIG